MPTNLVLQTWKEISEYVGRTERTLQHWEQEFGFPVHRPSGKARSSVMALSEEIREWTRGKPSLLLIKGSTRLSRAKLLPNPISKRNSGNHPSGIAPVAPDTRPAHQFAYGKMLVDVTLERLQLSEMLWKKQQTLQGQIANLLREQQSLREKLRSRSNDSLENKRF